MKRKTAFDVPAAAAGLALADFLASRFPYHDRAGWCGRIRSGHVTVNAQMRLPDEALGLLGLLSAKVRWTWIVGNHDRAMPDPLGGDVVAEADLEGLILRHEADPEERRPEISGHYHPKLNMTLRGRRVSRPCFVAGRSKLILPSFGVLTGGMDAADPVILETVGRDARALVAVQERLLDFPLAA